MRSTDINHLNFLDLVSNFSVKEYKLLSSPLCRFLNVIYKTLNKYYWMFMKMIQNACTVLEAIVVFVICFCLLICDDKVCQLSLSFQNSKKSS
jgi:hypothetical protein